MKKQKQAKKQELKEIIENGRINLLPAERVAENILAAGYRKMPENAVVIGGKERDEEIRACNEEQAELKNEIYALKVKVETLGEENNALSNDNINLEMNLQSLAEENERLKAKNAKYLNAIEDFTAKKCCLKYDIAKILVKEFAEELKEKFKENEDCFFDLQKEIDELLKEYEE